MATGPCLFIHSDNEKRKQLVVHLNRPEDWKQQHPKADIIHVYGDHTGTSSDCTIYLAMALKAHPAITTIRLNRCYLEELGPLRMAMIEVPREQLLVLEFHECLFHHVAAKAIAFMIREGSIGELTFTDCNFDSSAFGPIEYALRENQSLRKYVFLNVNVQTSKKAYTEICNLIMSNANMVKLGLSTDHGPCWDVFHAANTSSAIKSFKLRRSGMSLPNIQPIVMMCLVLRSLKELILDSCRFDSDALEFLIKTFSENQVLDTLKLESANLDDYMETPMRSFGNLQVRELSLKGTELTQEFFSQMVDDIASNSFLRSLDLTGGAVSTDEAFQNLCDLLRQNLGPSELKIDGVGTSSVQMITEALQQNSSLRTLAIGDLNDSCFVAFARGLANMSGLRTLTIHFHKDDELTTESFQALEDSLQENTTVNTLALYGIDSDHAIAKRNLPMIRYYLAINRVGRHSLMTANVPEGTWSHVLARSSTEADGIYFVLTAKPDIVSPTRKRKV